MSGTEHGNPQAVAIGTTVALRDEETGEVSVYCLAPPEEADISRGRLSVASPVGRGILGAMPGDTVEVQVPDGVRVYTVDEVS